MNIRLGNENDYLELAELKLMHMEEDDLDYDETNLLNINREAFVSEYVSYGLVINQSLGMKEMDFQIKTRFLNVGYLENEKINKYNNKEEWRYSNDKT